MKMFRLMYLFGRVHTVFYELKKDGDIKKSSKVHCISREYADTYEECVELYNSLIDEEIKRAKEVIEAHKKQKIIVEGE